MTPPQTPTQPTQGYIKFFEGIFLLIVLIALAVILWNVIVPARELISLAEGNFKLYKLAYDAAVINTFVGPFEKIVGAFVVYAFGKFGVTALDNKTRIANKLQPRNISLFG